MEDTTSFLSSIRTMREKDIYILEKAKDFVKNVKINNDCVIDLINMGDGGFYRYMQRERDYDLTKPDKNILALLQINDRELIMLFFKYVKSFSRFADEKIENILEMHEIDYNFKYCTPIEKEVVPPLKPGHYYVKLYSKCNIDFDIDIDKYAFAFKNVYELWLNIYYFLLKNASLTDKEFSFDNKNTNYLVFIDDNFDTHYEKIHRPNKIPCNILNIKELRESLEYYIEMYLIGDDMESTIDQAFQRYILKIFTSEVLYVRETDLK